MLPHAKNQKSLEASVLLSLSYLKPTVGFPEAADITVMAVTNASDTFLELNMLTFFTLPPVMFIAPVHGTGIVLVVGKIFNNSSHLQLFLLFPALIFAHLAFCASTFTSADNFSARDVQGGFDVSEVLVAFLTRLPADWKDATAGHPLTINSDLFAVRIRD